MDSQQLRTISKSEIPLIALKLTKEDVDFLVQTLLEKDDALR